LAVFTAFNILANYKFPLNEALAVNPNMETVMSNAFLNVDLLKWVYGTVEKVQNGAQWNDSWKSTYLDIGGISKYSSKKSCPMNASRVLYETGRITGCGIDYKYTNLQDVWRDTKNGVYALIAIDVILNDKSIDYEQLKKLVYAETLTQFKSAPKTDQGAIRLVFMLWKLGKVQC